MKLFRILACSLLMNIACGQHTPPNTTPPVVTDRAVAVFVYDESYRPVEGATCQLQTATSVWKQADAAANKDGYVIFSVVSVFLTDTQLQCSATGLSDFSEHRQLLSATDEYLDHAIMHRLHFDPQSIPASELILNWRSAIATVQMALPFGPRPGQSNNVLFTDMYGAYGDTDRSRARHEYLTVRRYRQWPLGPINSGNYAGQYPWLDYSAHPDILLDLAQEIYDGDQGNHGLPVFFLVPAEPDRGFQKADGSMDWDKIERELTPIYTQPRWQQMARVVVFCWECDGVVQTNEDWLRAVRWMARVLPNAKRGVHFSAGHGAPCNHADLEERGLTEATCWDNVAPYLHFFASQDFSIGGWNVEPGRTNEEQWKINIADNCKRFATGYGGFPTFSATPGESIKWLMFEYASYKLYNDGSVPESEAQRWGNLVLDNPYCGPVGAGDGSNRQPR